MMPMFSVIVPIYKVEKYLKICIKSILNQTFEDFELILVDDGSPDNCPKICDEFQAADSRVKVIHKKNGGLVAARNTGIGAAKGKYICYVDGDDWIADNLLETVWKKALYKQELDMVVFNAYRQFENKRELIPYDITEGLYDKDRLNKEIYPYMMYDARKTFCKGLIFPVAWNKIFRREFLQEHYCREERIRMGEDNAFVFECLYYAEKVFFCEDVLYYYNQMNMSSMVHSYDEKRFENNKLLMDYIDSRLLGKNEVIDSQINAFKAYWLIMAVFHEVKCGRNIIASRKHLKVKIREMKVLQGINSEELPKIARIYMFLLKKQLYLVALFGAKIISKIRG